MRSGSTKIIAGFVTIAFLVVTMFGGTILAVMASPGPRSERQVATATPDDSRLARIEQKVDQMAQQAQQPQQQQEQEAPPNQVEPIPVNFQGCGSWSAVKQLCLSRDGYAEFLLQLTGISMEDLDQLIAREAKGETFVVTLPRGTVITNSGIDRGYHIYSNYVLTTDRACLVNDLVNEQGEPSVLVSCGNPVKIGGKPSRPRPRVIVTRRSSERPIQITQQVTQQVVVNVEQPCPQPEKPDKPCERPKECEDPGPDRHDPDKNWVVIDPGTNCPADLAAPTHGYIPGQHEDVVQEETEEGRIGDTVPPATTTDDTGDVEIGGNQDVQTPIETPQNNEPVNTGMPDLGGSGDDN